MDSEFCYINYYLMLDLKTLVGSHFIFGLEGTSASDKTLSFIEDFQPAGFILMGPNCESPEQVFDLTMSLQKVSSRPLLICVDQEGGRVKRLKSPFLQFPEASQLGQKNSPKLVFEASLALGSELRSVGINLDCAPVCDVLTNPKNEVIGNRAYSSDIPVVEALASAMTRGLQKAHVLACAKHFPGHGDTFVDSHIDLPRVTTSLETLERREFLPFKKCIKSGVASMMTAHLVCEGLDKKYPSTLSPNTLHLLNQSLRFNGLIISDDMNMGALSKNYAEEEAIILSVLAGVDLLLYCDFDHSHHENVFEILLKAGEKDKNLQEQLNLSAEKLRKKRVEFQLNLMPQKNEWQKIIGCEAHTKIEETLSF
ncbi:MAG TPA: beta-N-acetylhexosaminidase [Bdellovibrionota bacterium]|nr:beta-N-acetylhexosaminidase [Bdellovibrionota bacterium]